jgi:hypothetical protein
LNFMTRHGGLFSLPVSDFCYISKKARFFGYKNFIITDCYLQISWLFTENTNK